MRNSEAIYYDNPEGEPFFYKGRRYEAGAIPALPAERLASKLWRMDNLYSIINEDGEAVPFKLRPIQRHFMENMWHRNVILKSRQHGFTTFIQIWMLDTALMVPNFSGVIIAHKKEEAALILKTKVEFPYTNLHPEILRRVGIVSLNKSLIEFSNGSSIRVTTSGRSGTAQTLHVSEYGHTAKHRPDVAEEIRLGSFPAIHQKGFVFVESTADGAGGDFHDLCITSLNAKREGKKLTPFDFKFFFYAWFDKPDNQLSDEDTELVEIRPEVSEYLDKIESEVGTKFTRNQRAWYAVNEDTFQDKMRQEHPSTPEEAFENSGSGNYYLRQMKDLRESGRLVDKLPLANTPVQVYWDIGVNDPACCWYIQRVGSWYHVLGYYEDTDNGMDVHIPAAKRTAEKQGWYLADEWVGPHDMKQRSKGQAKTLVRECAEYGAKFVVVPKVPQKILSIQASRRILDLCKFDSSGPNMELGISRLDNYRKQWNKQLRVWSDQPRKDMAGHGADAFQCFAMHVEQGYDEANAGKAQADPRLRGVATTKSQGNSMRAYT